MTDQQDTSWIEPFFANVTKMPGRWEEIFAHRHGDGRHYLRSDGLSVILSGHVEADGKRWLHLSCARQDRLPSWSEYRDVKVLFLGDDTYAYAVCPPMKYYVNLNPFCLHWFHCLDGDPLPEFSGFIPALGNVRTL